MASQFGLVCITHSEEVRYRTITRKRLLQQSEPVQLQLLEDLYRSNIQRLDTALHYCKREGIFLYRIPSSIFPSLGEDIGRKALRPLSAFVETLGAWAIANNIRLVMHPDQFVVLSSDSENVVANSIKILRMHADIMDLLHQGRTCMPPLQIPVSPPP
jgi:UV DNA damage endonuclease